MAVAGAWALTLGIGPLARDSTHGAIHRAPGRRREQARERPGESYARLRFRRPTGGGVPGLARFPKMALQYTVTFFEFSSVRYRADYAHSHNVYEHRVGIRVTG